MLKSVKKIFSTSFLSAVAFGLILSVGAANAKTTKTPAATTTPTTDSATSTTPAATPAPATEAPAAAPAPTKADTTPATTSVTSKNIEITKISNSGINKGVIDVYFTLANSAKFDDALSGAESDVTDKLDIYTGDVGKEVVSPNFRVDVPAGKSATLEAGKQVLRLSDVPSTVKDGSHVQVFLHFRSAPNAKLDLVVHKKTNFLGF